MTFPFSILFNYFDMLVDIHSHTTFSDGKCSHDDMLQAAISRGISVYGFSDHICFHQNSWTTPLDRLDAMKGVVDNLKAVSPIKVLFGMEVDFVPGCEEVVRGLKKKMSWDYLIGSVHYIGDWSFDSDRDSWAGKDVDVAFADYLDLLEMMVDSQLYNVVGHLDLPKKYGHFPSRDYIYRYRSIGEKIRSFGMAYEINTNGLNKPCHDFYPARELVELLFSIGVDVTLGADAHHSSNVAQFFDEAVKLLREVGYTRICYFEDGVKQYLPL